MSNKPCLSCGFSSLTIETAPPIEVGDVARAWVACGVCAATGPAVSSDVSEAEARLLAVELWERRETKKVPDGVG